MPDQLYTIIAAKWWTTSILYVSPYTIAAVAIASGPNENDWKAYIGHAPGIDSNEDTQIVAAYGAKLSKQEAAGLFPDLDINHYKD